MIHKEMTIIDLGGDNWSRLMRLPRELAALRDDGDAEPRRVLLVVYRGLKVLKAMDALDNVAVDVEWHGTSRLDLVAKQTGYPLVVALEETSLARVFGHAQRELDFRDDFLEQSAGFARGVAREWRKTIFTYPPVPYRVVDSLTRALIGDNTVFLFAVTEKGRVWTSAVVGYRDGEFWLLTSLDTIGMEEGNLRDGGLGYATDMLSSKFGGTVRAMVVERSELVRVFCGRFPALDALWALNTGDIRLVKVPWRWKALLAAASIAASLK
jgi:hypothetical protein